MIIQITYKKQIFEMELMEAVEKLFDNKKCEFKNTKNVIPDILARKILTYNIDPDYINKRFSKGRVEVRFTIFKYCFDKLTELNKFKGFIEWKAGIYRSMEHNPEYTETCIGYKNYRKYNNEYLLFKNINDKLESFKREHFTDEKFNFYIKVFENYANINYIAYLKFMQHFNLKIKKMHYGTIITSMSSYREYNHPYILKLIPQLTDGQKNVLLKKALEDRFCKEKFFEFCKKYNVEEFMEAIMLYSI